MTSSDSSEPNSQADPADDPRQNHPNVGAPAAARAGLAFVMIALLIDILGIGIIIPVLPELVKEFASGDASRASFFVGIISATYAGMQFVCAPIVGALSDRIGRRPVLLGSMLGLSIDYLVQGFAPTLIWLFVGRAIAGVFGASITTVNAFIADVSDETNRARNFGLVGVMFGVGFIIGPALGGWLGEWSLRAPFFASAGLAIANFVFGYFVLPESLPAAARRPFTWRGANPIASIATLRHYPAMTGIAVATAMSSLAQRGLESVWVLHAGYRYGWDKLTNGMTLALVGVMAIIVQGGLVGPAVKRFGARMIAVVATAIAAASFLGYGSASEGWMVLVVIVLGSLGGMAVPAKQTIIGRIVPPEDQGKVQGSIAAIISATSVMAPLVFASGIFAFFTSDATPLKIPGSPFYVGGLLLIAATLTLHRTLRAPSN